MVNRTLFQSSKPTSKNHMTKNAAGGDAYELSPEHALAKYAFTGTLHDTHYVSASAHLETVLSLCRKVSPEFIAKTAIASREGHMKDMPAMLAAYLNAVEPKLLSSVFERIIDNGKMLKNFAAIVRSGVTGRRGFGSSTRNAIRKWLDGRSDAQLLRDSIGGRNKKGDVALEHIISMVHPKPKNKYRSALYAWLRGGVVVDDTLLQEVKYRDNSGTIHTKTRTYNKSDLPDRIRLWEEYKSDPKNFESPPKVPFQMLTSLKLGVSEWETIAKNMSWQELRQNLETLTRHGVFDSPRMVEYVCKRLVDRDEISSARVLPYQILSTYLNTGPMPSGFGFTSNYWRYSSQYDKKGSEAVTIPQVIRDALETALEIALENVPMIEGDLFICTDTSGSMGYPITGKSSGWGYGNPPATKVRCVDVAGLITAAMLRRNPMAQVLPFSTKVHDVKLNPMDTVMSNAMKFASLGGGGTKCSEPLRVMNVQQAKADVVIYVSDQESWSDSGRFFNQTGMANQTAMMQEWQKFKARNENAKLICIDLTPSTNAQITTDSDILLIGGFSDKVFSMMDAFVKGKISPQHWIGLIEEIEL